MRKLLDTTGVFVMWIGVGIMLLGGMICGWETFNRECEQIFGDKT